MYRELESYVNGIAEEIIKDRRYFHTIPEVRWEEVETSKQISKILSSLGFTVFNGKDVSEHGTGVVGELKNGEGPVIAIRFDIDALPIDEPKTKGHQPSDEGFASKRDGFMHACGHDGHIAVGLGCARAFMHMKDKLKGTIRLIFQPAEEGCCGAREVAAKGWLSDVDFFMAGHTVGREYDDTGKLDVIPGCSTSLASSKIDVSYKGHACHASEPEKGSSVMLSIASAVMALNAIPRNSNGGTFINVGKVVAGEGRNIISESGYMELEVRGATTELNQYMEDKAVQIVKSCADMYGNIVDCEIVGKGPSLSCSEELSKLCMDVCSEKLTGIKCGSETKAFKASEDASVMIDEVKSHGGKGIFFLFTTDTTAPLHDPIYTFNEEILVKAVKVYGAMVLSIMN